CGPLSPVPYPLQKPRPGSPRAASALPRPPTSAPRARAGRSTWSVHSPRPAAAARPCRCAGQWPEISPSGVARLAGQPGEVVQHLQANSLALLRVELEGINVIARDDRGEIPAVVGRRAHDRCVARRAVVRVDEVGITRVWNTLKQGRAALDVNLVPA